MHITQKIIIQGVKTVGVNCASEEKMAATRFGAALMGIAAAAGGAAVMGFDHVNRLSLATTGSTHLASSSPSKLEAAHDDVRLGNDHCDCVPLWECMVANCDGESCKACDHLDIQLRACLAKVRWPCPLAAVHRC